MTNFVRAIEQEITSWPGVSAYSHRFGGREFRFDRAEIGHVHAGGTVDIPFTRSLHDALLAAGLAEQHRWVPDSGWITFHARSEDHLRHALWLMRISYLRYALKRASDPQDLLEQESEKLHLTPQFTSLLRDFVPARVNVVSAERLSRADV